jgi:hypothetical protein
MAYPHNHWAARIQNARDGWQPLRTGERGEVRSSAALLPEDQKRSVVVLELERFGDWMMTGPSQIEQLLHCPGSNAMTADPVAALSVSVQHSLFG